MLIGYNISKINMTLTHYNYLVISFSHINSGSKNVHVDNIDIFETFGLSSLKPIVHKRN